MNIRTILAIAGAALPLVAMSEETASQQPTQEMSKIKVQAAEVNDPTTEGTGYAASATTLGKDARPLRELPHSITILTREQLTDQNLNTIEAALKNVTGVTIQRLDAAGLYSSIMARGYTADTYQLDGLTVQADVNGIYFDLAAYDRIEVQRGAAGLFSGAGEPGVTVNMARKRAWSTLHLDGALTAGSWNDRRLDLDVTGPLNSEGTLRGRAVGVVQNFDTFMDQIDDNKKRMFYGTLETDLGERTTISVGATWQNVDTLLSRGLPTFANAQLIDMPRSTMPVADWNYQELDSKSAFAELEHRGEDGALFKVALRHLDRTNEAAYIDPSVPAADGTMNAMTASAFEREDIDNSFDVYYSKPLNWGDRTHNLLFGADYRRSHNTTDYSPYTIPIAGSFNLFDFDHHGVPKPDFDLSVNVSDAKVTSYGAYTQLRYKVASAWTLIGGGRLSWWESDSVSNGTRTSYDAESEFTPYAAAIFDVSSKVSLYASYNEIFKAQSSRTVTGEQIEPRTGRQVELGVKGDAAEGMFLYSAALYRLIDENRAIADPLNTGFSVPSGKARAQGFEIDARGELSPQWSLSAGYAFTETEYLRSTPAQRGQPVSSFTPKHSGNLWVHYSVDERLMRGVELGFGLRSVSDFYNGTGAQLVRGPGYTVFQLGGSYQITPKVRLSVNVDNLFDKEYWEKVSGVLRQNFFGEPRRISVSLRGSL